MQVSSVPSSTNHALADRGRKNGGERMNETDLCMQTYVAQKLVTFSHQKLFSKLAVGQSQKFLTSNK